MYVLSGLCSDCRRLRDGVRTLAHEFLLETDSCGQTYQCLICDAHLICQRKGNSTYWTLTPGQEPQVPIVNPTPPSPQPDRRSHPR
jgi:hypothetical protein